MTERVTSYQCALCRHYRGGLACLAFTDGIPEDILVGGVSHTEPYPGDNGIQYEPIGDNGNNHNNRPRRSSAPSEND